MTKLINAEKPTIKNYVDGIRLRLGDIATSILEIGELYCEALQKYSNAKKVFSKEFPNVRDTTWQKFKLIGEHKLASSAFFLSDTLAGKLVRARIPVEKQKQQISSMGVTVFRASEKKVVTVPFTKFTEEDERVFFDDKKGVIRSVDQQRDFVAAGYKTPKPKAWAVVDGGIKVRRACFISWAELQHLEIFKTVK